MESYYVQMCKVCSHYRDFSQENMGRVSSIPVRLGHFYSYVALENEDSIEGSHIIS